MSLQLKLNQKIAAAQRYKLQPFSDDLFSTNGFGRFSVFFHAEAEESGLMTVYSPLLRFTATEFSEAVMRRLLQLNLPSSPAHIFRVGVDAGGQLWLTEVIQTAEFLKPEFSVDTLLDNFFNRAESALQSLDSVVQSTADTAPVSVSDELISPSQMLWG